jgi:hypothetical protein
MYNFLFLIIPSDFISISFYLPFAFVSHFIAIFYQFTRILALFLIHYFLLPFYFFVYLTVFHITPVCLPPPD